MPTEKWVKVLEAQAFKEEIFDIVQYTKKTIVPGDFDADQVPYNDLTVGMNEDGDWSFQTGDNSFTGGAYGYPHWAVTSILEDSDPEEVFNEIADQLGDLLTQ